MLVLSTKSGQQIPIGDGIFVKVLRIQGNTVRIGIDAPREVQVRRLELPEVMTATIDIRRTIVSSCPPPAMLELSG